MRSETIKNDIKRMLTQLTDMIQDKEEINVKSIVSSVHNEIDKYNVIDAFVIREYLKDSISAINASKQVKTAVVSSNLQQVNSPDGYIHVVDMNTKNIVYTTKIKEAADEYIESHNNQAPSIAVQGAPEVVGPKNENDDENNNQEETPNANQTPETDIPDPLDNMDNQENPSDLDQQADEKDNYDLQNIKETIQKSTDLLSMIENAIDTVSDLDSITELVTIKVAIEDKIDRLNSLTPEDERVSEILDSLNILMSEVESKAIDIVNKSTPGIDKESITPSQEVKNDIDKMVDNIDKQPIEQKNPEQIKENIEPDKDAEGIIGDNKEDINSNEVDDDPYSKEFYDDTDSIEKEPEIPLDDKPQVDAMETTDVTEPLDTVEQTKVMEPPMDDIQTDNNISAADDTENNPIDSDADTMKESIDQLQSMISELDSLIQDVSSITQTGANNNEPVVTNEETPDVINDEFSSDSIDPIDSQEDQPNMSELDSAFDSADNLDVSPSSDGELSVSNIDNINIEDEDEEKKSPINSSELIPSNDGVLEIGRDKINPETTAKLPLEGENPLQADVLIPVNDGVLEIGRDEIKPETTATLPETGKNPLQAEAIISQEWVTNVLNKNSLVYRSVKRKGPNEYVINTGNKGVMSSIEWKAYSKTVISALVKAGWDPYSELTITIK